MSFLGESLARGKIIKQHPEKTDRDDWYSQVNSTWNTYCTACFLVLFVSLVEQIAPCTFIPRRRTRPDHGDKLFVVDTGKRKWRFAANLVLVGLLLQQFDILKDSKTYIFGSRCDTDAQLSLASITTLNSPRRSARVEEAASDGSLRGVVTPIGLGFGPSIGVEVRSSSKRKH